MSQSFCYSRSIYIQWMSGFVFLFFFTIFILFNPDSHQRLVGIFIVSVFSAYCAFLYSVFLRNPSKVSISDETLTLGFRKRSNEIYKWEEIESIREVNNPFFENIKGAIEIKIINSDIKYKISGTINNSNQLIEQLNLHINVEK